MVTFHLKVMTVDHCFYDGEGDRIIIRTTQGDAGILPGHVPYVAAIGIGGLTIIKDGEKRVAAVSGGFVEVSKEQTVVLARTCEWADEIDARRAGGGARPRSTPAEGERPCARSGAGEAQKSGQSHPRGGEKIGEKPPVLQTGGFFVRNIPLAFAMRVRYNKGNAKESAHGTALRYHRTGLH